MPFSWKKHPLVQRFQKTPGAKWVWALTIDGAPVSRFDWPDVLQGLEGLRMDEDSYLVMERRNSENAKESGFLQCERILEGDCAGWYAVECGYPGPNSPVLRKKQFASLAEVVPVFEAVFRQKGLAFTGFSDMSAAMSQTEHKVIS